MKYNGMEVHEADGKDYHLGMTPKRMLVWDDPDGVVMGRDVLGFFNGFWIAAFPDGRGVHNWKHAAEFSSTPTLRPFKSAKELDNAIAKHGPSS